MKTLNLTQIREGSVPLCRIQVSLVDGGCRGHKVSTRSFTFLHRILDSLLKCPKIGGSIIEI
jgi:hypothetical protein